MGDDRKVPGGGRVRPESPPSDERLRDLSRRIAEGRYRVPPDEVASAILRALTLSRQRAD